MPPASASALPVCATVTFTQPSRPSNRHTRRMSAQVASASHTDGLAGKGDGGAALSSFCSKMCSSGAAVKSFQKEKTTRCTQMAAKLGCAAREQKVVSQVSEALSHEVCQMRHASLQSGFIWTQQIDRLSLESLKAWLGASLRTKKEQSL